MSVKVLVLSAPVEPPLYVECLGRRVVLGRATEADVRLPDPSVSAEHALLQKRGRHYLVSDQGSSNGTAVLTPQSPELVWLSSDSPRVVRDGDQLLLGRVLLELRTETDAEGEASEDLARDLVTVGLSSIDVEVTDELIESALEELTKAPVERMTREEEELSEEPPSAPAHATGDERPRLLTDFVLMSLALLVGALSLLALYWLVVVRPGG